MVQISEGNRDEDTGEKNGSEDSLHRVLRVSFGFLCDGP
jgi:hypothetical protein